MNQSLLYSLGIPVDLYCLWSESVLHKIYQQLGLTAGYKNMLLWVLKNLL